MEENLFEPVDGCHSFQSALFSLSRGIDDDMFELKYDHALLSFMKMKKESKSQNLKNLPLNLDTDDIQTRIASKLLCADHDDNDDDDWIHDAELYVDMSGILEFVNDMSMKPAATNMDSIPNPPKIQKCHEASNEVYEIPPVEACNKRNPFQSAKDQYIKEGGGAKFPSTSKPTTSNTSASNKSMVNNTSSSSTTKKELPPELAHLDPILVEKIECDIIQNGSPVEFKDIAGLEFAKKCVTEIICWPMSRPDLFKGLRSLPKGLLLFGPPGTGKTLIGKAIAHQTGATFFSISSSSLTSKWIGEGEKTVRVLFELAAYYQPSVVFIDEVDSLLSQRSSDENEASRRMKTEFLIQLDGAGTDQNARVVIIGATNRPDELDEAARRRFVKRIYIPLPDIAGRNQLFQRLLLQCEHELSSTDIDDLAMRTDGYSGADIKNLCTEAAMGPMRELAMKCGNLTSLRIQDVPPVTLRHFLEAFETVVPSVSPADLKRYIDWNNLFGSFRRME